MHNIQKNKLQLVPFCRVFSFPSIVCNKCICWSQNTKLKNVNIKIGRFDHYFCAGYFFSLL